MATIIEDFKRPADTMKECKKKFEEYCEGNGLKTEMQKAASAHNPLYYDYLLDFVTYENGDKNKQVEKQRTTYMKAAGRFLMLQQVAYALQRERPCEVRIVTPAPQFIPSNGKIAAICTCEIRIEALYPGTTDWKVLYSGTGTARRESTGYKADFYVEKAETAARARAIAAAGIGIDIHGGLSTFEDVAEAMAGEAAALPSDQKVKVQMLEAKLRSCKNMDEVNALVPEIKKAAEGFTKEQNAELSDVFQEVINKLTNPQANAA